VVQRICIRSPDVTASLIKSCFINIQNGLPFSYRLTQVVLLSEVVVVLVVIVIITIVTDLSLQYRWLLGQCINLSHPRPAYWPARLRLSSFSNKNGRRSQNAAMFVREASRPFDGLKIFCCSNWTY